MAKKLLKSIDFLAKVWYKYTSEYFFNLFFIKFVKKNLEVFVMNKTELVASIAAKAGIAKKDAEKAVAALVDTVAAELKAGGKIQLDGFGTFEVRERAARTGINPQTGKLIEIAASKNPVFKAGKALKDAIK